MISIKKKIFFIFILFVLTSCSLNSGSKFWTKKEFIKKERAIKETELFQEEK